MRILALSDLNWSPTKSGTDLQELLALVHHVQPELVLLAGDLVDNDKGHNHQRCLPYWRDLGIFLQTLARERIHCCFVRGNWDEVAEYESLAMPESEYIHEISYKTATIGRLRLLGIPNAATTRKVMMRDLIASQTEAVDIVLTHADGVRRMRLFELPTKIIITGHFDNKLSYAMGKALIAFENYPGQFAAIDYVPDEILVSYYYGRLGATSEPYEARLTNGRIEWTRKEPIKEWMAYGRMVELLFAAKERFATLDAFAKRREIQILLEHGVYKAHIREYIPGSSAFLA
jgi:predicted phosphodiesterase